MCCQSPPEHAPSFVVTDERSRYHQEHATSSSHSNNNNNTNSDKPILVTGTLLPDFPSDNVVETGNAKLRDKVLLLGLTFLFLHCIMLILRRNSWLSDYIK